MSNTKITKKNLLETLKRANQLRDYIALELTIVEQAISNANLANVLTSTYANHTANVIVSDIINCIILNMRRLVEFLCSMLEYVKEAENIAELAKIHEQPSNVDEVICIGHSKATTKPLNECSDKIKDPHFQIQQQEIKQNVQKFNEMLSDIIKKWDKLYTREKELSNDLLKNQKICVKLRKLRNQRAHFNIEKEEGLRINELRDYFDELTKHIKSINFIVNRTCYNYEEEHEQDKRSADEFWNLLKK